MTGKRQVDHTFIQPDGMVLPKKDNTIFSCYLGIEKRSLAQNTRKDFKLKTMAKRVRISGC